MADANVNPWFRSADRVMTDLAEMLEAIDAKGHLDDEMREALKQHAQNQIEILPRLIEVCANVAATAAGSIEKHEASQVLFLIAAQAEKLSGMSLIHEVFSEPRRTPKAA